MKIYKMHFHDIEHGTIVQWRTSKKACAKLKSQWRKDFPLRELIVTQRINFPLDQQGLVAWLNENATR